MRETPNMGALRSILTSKWFWVIVVLGIFVVLTPFLFVLFIAMLPPPFNALATISVVLAWGIAAAYKDWILSKTKEEKPKTEQI